MILKSNAQKKSGQSVKDQPEIFSVMEPAILAVAAPECCSPEERSCWGRCLEHWVGC